MVRKQQIVILQRPGYSEHQTGLTFDLIDTSGNLVTEPGPSKWLLKNAAKYGFVVRYQEGKEKVTGYMPESWHLRYIGKKHKILRTQAWVWKNTMASLAELRW